MAAAWSAMSWSSPQTSSRREPSKLSQTIARFSRGCLSQTSWAMLYLAGTFQLCVRHISLYRS
jgi:hypothetical protein